MKIVYKDFCLFIQSCLLLLFAAKPEKREPIPPSAIEISLSQLPVLTCNFTGRPKVNVTWSYSDAIKGVESSVYDGMSGLIWTSRSLNVTVSVCKTYVIRCLGQNGFGEAEQTIMLNVKGR